MEVIMFILGTIFGSFYNVIGYRIPNGKSIIYPHSHCTKCKRRLKFYELIPIFSYIFLKGKCMNCKNKISIFYPTFEFISGLLFMFTYMSFGFSQDFIIAITFVSMMIIVTISDFLYMIIPDEVLIFFGIVIFIEIIFISGISSAFISVLNGCASFIIMYIIKKIGDFIFKRESMGGGDIKLMFISGMVLTFPISTLSIFIGSFIGIIPALLYAKKHPEGIIPFGPLLALGSIVLLLFHIDIDTIVKFYNI